MIKNIVFDLGGVLVDFNPENYLNHIGFDKNDITLFTDIVFYSKEWSEYTTSKYTIKQTAENIIKKYPQYEEKINRIIDNIDYKCILFEIINTAEYLKELKEEGYNIYVLSDLNIDSYKYNKQFKFFDMVQGGVYSFEVGTTKPNGNNYKTLLEKYKLVPDETIFIDDRFENIKAANKFGIHGIHFTTLDEVKQQVDSLLCQRDCQIVQRNEEDVRNNEKVKH